MTAAVLDRPVPAALIDRRPPLTRLVGLEVRKSLSTRSGLALAGVAAMLPAVAITWMVAVHSAPPGAATMLAVLGTLAAVLLIALGVLSTAGEWTHGTVQTTFLAVPRRVRVLTAKYAATALLGTVIAVVVVAGTLAVAALGTGPEFSWSGTGVAVAATIGAAAALTVVGAGIGAAVGNAPGRADRDLPGPVRRDQHPQCGQAGLGQARRPAVGRLRPGRGGRRGPPDRGPGRLGPRHHRRRHRRHPPPRRLLTPGHRSAPARAPARAPAQVRPGRRLRTGCGPGGWPRPGRPAPRPAGSRPRSGSARGPARP